MPSSFLLYGANGYTGELIARHAVSQGLRPILAGRRAEALEPLAKELGLECRAVGLDDPKALDAAVAGHPLVLHCAGPFARTSQPMIEACLRNRAHYLDITGEMEVFEKAARQDKAAKQAGVMLMPGVGFDVVPSDCLAAHLKRRLPTATHLSLAFKAIGRPSHGTTTTMVENLSKGCAIRKDGKIVPVPAGHATRKVDFGRGPDAAIAIPWGDVATAWYSTGIPNIEVFIAVPWGLRVGMKLAGPFGGILGSGPAQKFLKARIPAGGPSKEDRDRGASLLWGEVRDESGQRRVSLMKTMEGYELTALAALLIAKRVLDGNAPAGFQTPAKAYGPDLVLEIEGSRREDVE